MKTAELIGPALDWAVAKCEGSPVHSPDWDNRVIDAYDYSTCWPQGGPIIEREGICTMCPPSREFWDARMPSYPPVYHRGPSPLVAAMRCYVAIKLGDDIEVPAELQPRKD